jgi:hypothetical protein
MDMSDRFENGWTYGDHPIINVQAMLPWCECEVVREGNSPIRLRPSAQHEGSSAETDRIINCWRPRLANLVDQSISMAKDLCEISWNGTDEPYPCCPHLKLIQSQGRDMRRFTDEACHLLLQACTKEEILESYWPDHRKPDARDIAEWMVRWALWLPDENGQFRIWSAFLPCEAIEAFYRYVHALVHDYYLEILELHIEWQENRERHPVQGTDLLPLTWEGPKEFQWIPPRLFVEGGVIWLNGENAQEIREWGVIAFGAWKFSLSEEKQEALYDLVHEADRLCPDPRFS